MSGLTFDALKKACRAAGISDHGTQDEIAERLCNNKRKATAPEVSSDSTTCAKDVTDKKDRLQYFKRNYKMVSERSSDKNECSAKLQRMYELSKGADTVASSAATDVAGTLGDKKLLHKWLCQFNKNELSLLCASLSLARSGNKSDMSKRLVNHYLKFAHKDNKDEDDDSGSESDGSDSDGSDGSDSSGSSSSSDSDDSDSDDSGSSSDSD